MIAAMGIGMAGVSMSTALVFVFAMGMVAGFALALYMKKCISTPNDEVDDWLCGTSTEYSASEQQIPEVTTVPPGPERTGGNFTLQRRKQFRVPGICFYIAKDGRAIHWNPRCSNLPPDRPLCSRPLCKTCAAGACVIVGSEEGTAKK